MVHRCLTTNRCPGADAVRARRNNTLTSRHYRAGMLAVLFCLLGALFSSVSSIPTLLWRSSETCLSLRGPVCHFMCTSLCLQGTGAGESAFPGGYRGWNTGREAVSGAYKPGGGPLGQAQGVGAPEKGVPPACTPLSSMRLPRSPSHCCLPASDRTAASPRAGPCETVCWALQLMPQISEEGELYDEGRRPSRLSPKQLIPRDGSPQFSEVCAGWRAAHASRRAAQRRPASGNW